MCGYEDRAMGPGGRQFVFFARGLHYILWDPEIEAVKLTVTKQPLSLINLY